jgi:hypothetical protein
MSAATLAGSVSTVMFAAMLVWHVRHHSGRRPPYAPG